MDTSTHAATATLQVAGAELYYELRGTGPLIALHAAPMDAASFTPLAELLAVDHTVLTSDPRGINRSRVDNRDQDVTPEMRAKDLAALLDHVDAGPATLFGSSGGAVSALALTQMHPELVTTVIAHEPPLAELLSDRQQVRTQTDDMIETYLAGDRKGAWKQFMETANIHLPDEHFESMFGGRSRGKPRPMSTSTSPTWSAQRPSGSRTYRPCVTPGSTSSSASARTLPTNSATAPPTRSRPRSASRRHCSRADTPASQRTPWPSRRGFETSWRPSDAPSRSPSP